MIQKQIDQVIQQIHTKIDTDGIGYNDAKIIMALQLIRLEIARNEKVSDYSIRALKEISAMSSFESYRLDYPAIYSAIKDMCKEVPKYTERWYDGDLEIIGFSHEKWCTYFAGATRYLLNDLRNL